MGIDEDCRKAKCARTLDDLRRWEIGNRACPCIASATMGRAIGESKRIREQIRLEFLVVAHARDRRMFRIPDRRQLEYRGTGAKPLLDEMKVVSRKVEPLRHGLAVAESDRGRYIQQCQHADGCE
jgi:hypothetical protein